tara:strand:- start:2602 stop:3471 length:870 start_codon:yes stop_codon:yes gene_type:complete
MKVNFFIVGAPKAGTTSLHYYLDEHPEVNMSKIKETNYFSDKEIKNQNLYYKKRSIKSLEEYHDLFQRESKDILFGETSPSYLFYRGVASKIKAYNPEAKIIIILRNPIDRAYSHYLMDYRLGLVKSDFADIISKKYRNKYSDLYFQQYIELGNYATQIARYHKQFSSDKLLILDYNDFTNNTNQVMSRIFNFLSLSDFKVASINQRYNSAIIPKNRFIKQVYSFIYLRNIFNRLLPKNIKDFIHLTFFNKDRIPSLKEETREKLIVIFKKEIENLEVLLKKDYSRWLK